MKMVSSAPTLSKLLLSGIGLKKALSENGINFSIGSLRHSLCLGGDARLLENSQSKLAVAVGASLHD
jgi:hypothetical protein